MIFVYCYILFPCQIVLYIYIYIKPCEIFLEAYSYKCCISQVFQVKVSIDITYINQYMEKLRNNHQDTWGI